MPRAEAAVIVHAWQRGDAGMLYWWKWPSAEFHRGTYFDEGVPTGLSRYIIDFGIMLQRNADTHKIHKVKMVASGATVTLSLQGTLIQMPQLQWENCVELKTGMWWAIPRWLCNMIVHEFNKGARTADYWWYWKDYTNGYWRNCLLYTSPSPRDS